jgi:hypothetical protein
MRQRIKLIDLLVYVAMVLILAAILFPVFARAEEKAKWASFMDEVRTGQTIPTADEQAMMTVDDLTSVPLDVRRRWNVPEAVPSGGVVTTSGILVTWSDGVVTEIAITPRDGCVVQSVTLSDWSGNAERVD